METDETITLEIISDPEWHTLHHINNVDEHDQLWAECAALRLQVDELHVLVLKLASTLNTILPMPIELEEQI